MLKLYMMEAAKNALTYEQLKPLENIYYKLPCDVRTKTIRPKNGFDRVYHADKAFKRWSAWSHMSPTELIDFFNRNSETKNIVDNIEFYLDKNYIITNQFEFYPTELRQYRWELNDEAREALKDVV